MRSWTAPDRRRHRLCRCDQHVTCEVRACTKSAFIRDLAMVMIVAGATTILFQRLRQPVLLGYILAGVLIGPHTPGVLVGDPRAIDDISNLGVVLLMFTLGLEFSVRKLREVGIGVLAVARGRSRPDAVDRLRHRRSVRLERHGRAVPRRDHFAVLDHGGHAHACAKAASGIGRSRSWWWACWWPRTCWPSSC